jgi:hypothetical protein
MNQADILKLAETAGFYIDGTDVMYETVHNRGEYCFSLHDEITKFAELVAQHERDAAYKRETEIVRLACKAAADQARDHQKEIEAIRARNKS